MISFGSQTQFHCPQPSTQGFTPLQLMLDFEHGDLSLMHCCTSQSLCVGFSIEIIQMSAFGSWWYSRSCTWRFTKSCDNIWGRRGMSLKSSFDLWWPHVIPNEFSLLFEPSSEWLMLFRRQMAKLLPLFWLESLLSFSTPSFFTCFFTLPHKSTAERFNTMHRTCDGK